MRSWIAYRLMRLALWVEAETTFALAFAMVAERAKEQMRVRGIVGVEEFEGEDGKTYARPIFADPEPTKH